MRKSIAIFVLLATIYCTNGASIECLKAFLKSRNVEEDLLSYVGHHTGNFNDCESEVRTQLAKENSNLRNSLSKDRTKRPFVECIMRDVEEQDDNDYENWSFIELAVEESSDWRFWNYFSKKSRLEEVRKKKSNFVNRALLNCRGHREYFNLFDEIFENQTKWQRSGEEEYCVRQHLIESKSLQFYRQYRFNLNPRNVKTDHLDCLVIVDEVRERVLSEIKSTKMVSACAMKVYREQNYADQLLKAEILSKLGLNAPDRSRERQDFTNSLIKISYDAESC